MNENEKLDKAIEIFEARAEERKKRSCSSRTALTEANVYKYCAEIVRVIRDKYDEETQG